MDNDKHDRSQSPIASTLPETASLTLNRANLPAVILGSLTFQRYPIPLAIDGIGAQHRDLLQRLDGITDPGNRAQQFLDYMTVYFRLHAPDEAGFCTQSRLDRSRADYLRLLRGWAFDAESRDAAVMKGWVESRFGLVPRFHHVAIHTIDDESYLQYRHEYAEGIYNTNALEAQLDLLYTYCQYELVRQFPLQAHITLYRGSNDIEKIELAGTSAEGITTLLLNNLNSFSTDMQRASEFGDKVISIEVPLSKIVFYSELIPKYLKAENEYIVLGGVYECRRVM